MATSYPGALDNFTNPTATDSLDSVTVPHASQHANANDAIEAIEAALGTNPKGTFASVKARLEDEESRIGALETTVDTTTTGLVDRVGALETTVDTATTGLVDRVDAIETGLGLTPFGGDLALSINQVTAAAADELIVGTDPGEVDDTATPVWFKFVIDGTEYGIAAYPVVVAP